MITKSKTSVYVSTDLTSKITAWGKQNGGLSFNAAAVEIWRRFLDGQGDDDLVKKVDRHEREIKRLREMAGIE